MAPMLFGRGHRGTIPAAGALSYTDNQVLLTDTVYDEEYARETLGATARVNPAGACGEQRV
ncbi:hypothetical protein [Streptomyces sp. NBC_01794]|uniref:hypothetical protein n=1 Tax=Streptomyces sp. NBC_01794 TaxID=2975942 RepID=UPI0030859051|nr:hypothetical protein OIE54_41040 [Streptomyces sp. NBC_01794]